MPILQPVPKVSQSDVARIVARDFAADEINAAHEILGRYGIEQWEREIPRVRIAALKLASGSLERLREHIAVAKADYRDVLAAAEYPQRFQSGFHADKLTPDLESAIIAADWDQYQEWFSRRSGG
jgi:hypothetical protein